MSRRGGSQVQTQAQPAEPLDPQGSVTVNDVCRMAFLQALMSISFMTEDRAKQMFREIYSVSDDSSFPRTIQQINMQLQLAQFKLKTVLSPVNKVKYIGFVNMQADTSSKLGTKYTIPQRDFFKATIEAIATSSSQSEGDPAAPRLSEIHILNIEVHPRAAGATQAGAASQAAGGPSQPQAVVAGKKLTKVEKQDTLRDLVSEGWLASAPGQNGYYCLGPRTFLELGDYLLSLEDVGEDTRKAWEDIV